MLGQGKFAKVYKVGLAVLCVCACSARLLSAAAADTEPHSVQATRKSDHTKFAVKVIDKKNCHSEGELEKVKDEIDIMRRVSHPNCIQFVDMFDAKDKLYIVMELATGGDMEEACKLEPNMMWPVAKLPCMLYQMLFALYAAQRELGLRHYDVKLLNFFLATPSKRLQLGQPPPVSGATSAASKPNSKPKAKAKPRAKSKPRTKAKPQAKAKSKSKSRAKAKSKSRAKPKPKPKAKAKATRAATKQGTKKKQPSTTRPRQKRKRKTASTTPSSAATRATKSLMRKQIPAAHAARFPMDMLAMMHALIGALVVAFYGACPHAPPPVGSGAPSRICGVLCCRMQAFRLSHITQRR